MFSEFFKIYSKITPKTAQDFRTKLGVQKDPHHHPLIQTSVDQTLFLSVSRNLMAQV